MSTIITQVGFGLYDKQGRELGVRVTFTQHPNYYEVHVQRTRAGALHGKSRAPFVVTDQQDAEFKTNLHIDGERYAAGKNATRAGKFLGKGK